MPNDELVVSDTSPLLNPALIQQLDLLESQFPSLAVPRQVWDELAAGEGVLDTLKELRDNDFSAWWRLNNQICSPRYFTNWIGEKPLLSVTLSSMKLI